MDTTSFIVLIFVIATATVPAISEQGEGPLDLEDEELAFGTTLYGDELLFDDLFSGKSSGDGDPRIDESPKSVISDSHPKKNKPKDMRVPKMDLFPIWLGVIVGVFIAMIGTATASIMLYRRKKRRILIEARNKEIEEEYITPLGFKMPTRTY